MSSQHKLIAGTVAVALLAGGGAALAAIELTSSSPSPQAAPAVTAPLTSGIGSYGLGGGRLGGRGLGGGLGPGDGDGDTGFDGHGRHFGGRGLSGAGMSAAATYLGLTSDVLRGDLESGQTLAQVARSQGKTVVGLVAAMVAARKQELTRAVASGVLTQAQADRLEQALAERMDALVNGDPSRPRFGPGGAPPGGGTGVISATT